MSERNAGTAPEHEGDDGAKGGRDTPEPDDAHGADDQRQTDAHQDAEIQRLKERLTRRETVLYAIAIFGFMTALASVAVSLLQWNIMRQQADDARAAMMLEHRAWIFVDSVKILREDPHILVSITYSNAGRTPATDVRVVPVVNAYSFDTRQRAEKPVDTGLNNPDDFVPGGGSSRGVMRPAEQRTNGVGVPSVVLERTVNARQYLVVAFTITYQDVFGVRRRTKVCYEIDRHTVDDPTGDVRTCEEHHKDDTVDWAPPAPSR